MTVARLKRAQELFEQALDRSSNERLAFLRTACDGDASLLDEVLSLLEHDQRAEDTFLQIPTFQPKRSED